MHGVNFGYGMHDYKQAHSKIKLVALAGQPTWAKGRKVGNRHPSDSGTPLSWHTLCIYISITSTFPFLFCRQNNLLTLCTY